MWEHAYYLDYNCKREIEKELIKKIIQSNSDYQILAEESGKSSDDIGNIFCCWLLLGR